MYHQPDAQGLMVAQIVVGVENMTAALEFSITGTSGVCEHTVCVGRDQGGKKVWSEGVYAGLKGGVREACVLHPAQPVTLPGLCSL
jgi:hypothetical protein